MTVVCYFQAGQSKRKETMPCRYDGPNDDTFDPKLRRELDALTRVSCDLRTIVRRHAPQLFNHLTEETLNWIKKHDREDEKRIAEEEARGERERVKRQALKKLTLEERRVLGL